MAATIWTPYCGAAPPPADLLARWNLDPVLILAIGLAMLAHRHSVGSAQGRQGALFGAAVAALFLFVSPFCALTSALFAARATHHALLLAVLAPLLVFALPPGRVRLPASLGTWTAIQAAVFWLWHAPAAYAWALSSDAVYWLMQLSLLGSAVGFWAAIRRSSAIAAAGALLATMVQMGVLGALLTFSRSALYAPHYFSTAAWGLTPLEDQQLAGLIMWAPAAGFYLAAALILVGRWLGGDDRRALAS